MKAPDRLALSKSLVDAWRQFEHRFKHSAKAQPSPSPYQYPHSRRLVDVEKD